MDNNPIAIVFSIFVSLLTTLGIGGQGNHSVQETTVSPREVFTVDFVTENSRWKVNRKKSVSIAFDTVPTPFPTAVDLVIEFSADEIEVLDIAQGDLWTNANVLKKEIDSKKGYVRFVIGQGFGAKTSNNRIIATLSVLPKKVAKDVNVLGIGERSKTASSGKTSTIQVKGGLLKVSIYK